MISTDTHKRKDNYEGDLSKKCDDTHDQVTLSSLSEMTGFPAEFIRSELMIKGDDLSLDELRKSVVDYLDTEILGQ